MRRRLTLAFVAMVAAALVLVGIVTLVLTVQSTRTTTRADLLTQARQLAAGLRKEDARFRPGVGPLRLRTYLSILRQPLRLDGEAVRAIAPTGRVFDVSHPFAAAPLPDRLTPATIDVAALLGGRATSGQRGAVEWAAAPFRANVAVGRKPNTRVIPDLTQVVVITRRSPTGLREAGPWFLIVSGVTLLAAAAAALWLGGRIVRPLAHAEAATRRIAGGDLSVQLPEDSSAGPELRSLARSINSMTRSLARSKGAERQFLLSVSHDLRTPLTSIRGYAEAIADGAAPDPVRAAEVISSEAGRLERLVQDLLDLARLDARRFSFDVRPVDLAGVVAATAAGFGVQAQNWGLHLQVERAGDAPSAPTVTVSADPHRAAQVIANLIENALKYASSTVTVRVATAGGAAFPELVVDDDGPGIAAEDLPYVFDRFYLSQRRLGRQVGSGLGLAIVHELVTAMGGSVRAESPTPGGTGTRVIVCWAPWNGPPASR